MNLRGEVELLPSRFGDENGECFFPFGGRSKLTSQPVRPLSISNLILAGEVGEVMIVGLFVFEPGVLRGEDSD